MTIRKFEEKTKDINYDHICSVDIMRKPIIYGFKWRDEKRFMGIRTRKAGVYRSISNRFYSSNKEDLYAGPRVIIKMSNSDSFIYEFTSIEETEEFHQHALNIINR